MKPDLCGQGLGYKLMDILKSESRRRYNNKTIILEVRSFNKRAINCYKKSGFKVFDIYKKDTLLGQDEFVKMELAF
ncbi:MAG: GNAT family N-acetyltransferase [Clostridium butyricum]|nr:GNAT family N-acetyltransferase [Clostridium butyricum]